jgi:glycosyltransferase involved in cell wall biosynthesis
MDGSMTVIEDWAADASMRQRFERLRVERHSANKGAFATINQGLDVAAGEWIGILNSDDCFHPDRLDLMLRHAIEHEGDILFSGLEVIDADGKRAASLQAAMMESFIDQIDLYPSINFAFMKQNLAGSTGNLFFSRSLFKKTGYFSDLKYIHDWEFIVRSTRYCTPQAVPQALYKYRLHGCNSFELLKFEQYFETQVLYRKILYSAIAKNYENCDFCSDKNWGILFDDFLNNDLKGASKIVGKGQVDYKSFADCFK